MIINTFYRTAGLVAPRWASRKLHERALLADIQGMVSTKGGYWGALGSFLKNPLRFFGSHSENAVPPDQFPQLTGNAWEIYRTNPHFKKIVRSLCSKVIGRGMVPNSQARDRNGKAYTEFRARAKRLWEDCHSAIDYRGKPGQGGKTLAGIQHLALKTIMLSGEQLYQLRPINQLEQDARGLPVPLTIQLIDPQRLADDMHGVTLEDGHAFYRGIELDPEGIRYRYWLRKYVYNAGNVSELSPQAEPYSAAKLFHVFLEDDDDQLRGTTWFAAALMPARHGNDLRFNFVKTSAMQACVVLSHGLAPGKSRFGTKGDSSTEVTDPQGNAITRFSPGMCFYDPDGKMKLHSPTVNISGYEGLVNSVSRDEAAAVPGIKASTVTGDYRGSSFSSERSADNDIWPEIEVIQDWFAAQFCQPIYEAIVIAAVADGYFDDIPGFSLGKFKANQAAYLKCTWQGPVARSINPVDDENASELRLRGGRSSPQKECAKGGTNFDENLDEIADAYQKIVVDRGLPEVVFNSIMGLDTKDLLSTKETQAATANGGANVAEEQAA